MIGRLWLTLTFALLLIAPSASADQVDDYVKSALAKDHVPGASVAVVRDGKVVLARGYGLANVELNAPATADTVYELLSLAKQFTATATLILVEEGKVHLDEPLSSYLPDSPEAWKGVTVRHLLTHTSGISDYTNAPGWAATLRQDRTPVELLKTVREMPLLFQPGERWRYSNSNYYLLGLLIEKVSGKSWGDFLTERILKPLGMNSTRVNEMSPIIPNRAAGYHWQQNSLINAPYISPTHKWAAGAILSTVNDLAKWDAALISGKLLSKATLGQMVTPAKLKDGSDAPYGFGNELEKDKGHRVGGHQGGGMAFNTAMRRYVDDKLTVIVLTNLTQGPSQMMARHIAAFYLTDLADKADSIKDTEPQITAMLKQVIVDAAKGTVNMALLTPQAQKELAPTIQQQGPRMLGLLGAIKSFDLLDRQTEGAKRIYTYRSIYEKEAFVWTFELGADGKIITISPRKE